MAQKPSIPKGTRDFAPQVVVQRNYIMDTIRTCFTQYGFQPIETPSFENSETLMGKYGDEGDQLIFKILDSGEYFKGLKKNSRHLKDLIEGLGRVLNHLFADNDIEKSYEFLKEKELLYLNIEKKSVPILNQFFDQTIEEILEAFKYLRNNSEELHSKQTSAFHYFVFRKFMIFYIEKVAYDEKNTIPYISSKALRYDLTVPFARYVVQHQNDITFPFKRYQMQPVWRADRPQKGRFREFYQCDADVVGSTSLWQEVELVQLYDAVFTQLHLDGVTIKMNNRKILSGIAEVIGASDKLIDFTVALDKLDKIGEEAVKTEMQEKGISQDAIAKVQPLFDASGSASEKLKMLQSLLETSKVGLEGVAELRFIVDGVNALALSTASLEIDVTLARGLNYYTGAIFEVAAPQGVTMGSIGGGGRYDDLTGIFGLKNVSGVGISFGLDRIYLVLEELGLFPETVSANTKVLFINFGEAEALYALKAIKSLRAAGIPAELYPDTAKMGKQMGYADKRNIPFTVLAGSSEMENKQFTVKNMISGNQELVTLEGLIDIVQ